MSAVGRIFNIQRYSTHDGPGIRTTVFFKGCNLRCAWCHNPESWSYAAELEYNPELCIGCQRCAQLCPNGAHIFDESGLHALDRNKCADCGACVDECYAGALSMAGVDMDAETLLREIETDIPYYAQSGGGVTFSGGECMTQLEYLADISALCHERGIHVAIDTAGNVPWSAFERVMPYADMFLYDFKAFYPDTHRRWVGVDNTRILDNLNRLIDSGARIWVRIPCIPGANTGELEYMAEWMSSRNIERVDLLAYHRLGEGKRKLLGLSEYTEFTAPSDADMRGYKAIFDEFGIDAHI